MSFEERRDLERILETEKFESQQWFEFDSKILTDL